MKRGLRAVVVGILLTLHGAGLRAHDETPRPIAEFRIAAAGDRLTVNARLPIAALADVNLPREDGRIDRRNLEQPLQIVARDLVASLEFEQNGVPLPAPAARATLTPDDAFVDVEIGYVIRPGVPNLAARLRTFRAGGNPVAIAAHFADAAAAPRAFTIAEGSERVTFNPDTTTATIHFVGRGARTLLDNWDVILFALCLMVPIRPDGPRRRALIALLVGEAVAAALTAAGWTALPPSLLPGVMAIAASVLVVVSLQAIVTAASRWLIPLALVFGLVNGVALGQTFRDALPFAGSHPAPAFATLIVIVLLVQTWVILLLSSASALLYRWGLSPRLALLATAVVVCHTALDLVIGRSARLAETAGISAEHFLTLLTLSWAALVIAAGLVSANRAANRSSAAGTPALADPASARP